MSRRAQAPVRTILPDPKFNNEMLAKFMNVVMKNGKKSAAERIIYGALDRIAEKTGKQGGEAIEVLSTRARQRQAGGRSEVAPRRRRHLPGAGRGARHAPPDTRDALGASMPRATAARSPWRSAWRMS